MAKERKFWDSEAEARTVDNYLRSQGIDPKKIRFHKDCVQRGLLNEGCGKIRPPSDHEFLRAVIPEVAPQLTVLRNLCQQAEDKIKTVEMRKRGFIEIEFLDGLPLRDAVLIDKSPYIMGILLFVFPSDRIAKGVRQEVMYYRSCIDNPQMYLGGLKLDLYKDKIEITKGQPYVSREFVFKKQPVHVIDFRQKLDMVELRLVEEAQLMIQEYLAAR